MVISDLFGHRINPVFAADAELSVRGAIFLVVAALPFLIPKGSIPIIDNLSDMGLYSPGVIIFVVYNLSRTFGAALQNTMSGLRGVVIASLNAWLLFTIFPDGVTDDSPPYVFWTGILWGVLFVCAFLFLKINIMGSIFAISIFCTQWMGFLTPGADKIVSPLHPGYSIYSDSCLESIVSRAAGMVFVLLVTLLPYPLLCLDTAKETMEELAEELPMILTLMLDHFCAETPNVYTEDQVERRMHHLRAKKDALQPLIACSWYETFGVGRSVLVRKCLSSFSSVMDRSFDQCFSLWAVHHRKESPPTAKKINFMNKSKTPSLKVIKGVEAILVICIKACSDGALSKEDEMEIQKCSAACKLALQELKESVKQSREEILSGDNEQDDAKVLYEELQTQQVLFRSLSICGKEVIGFADKLVQFKAEPSTFPQVKELGGLWSLIEGVTEPENMRFASRAALSIFISMIIGYNGYGKLIAPANAGVASTAACLFSRFAGSAVVADLQRIQGVVVGTMMARVLGSLFASCAWYDLTGLVTVIFLWAVVFLFIAHNSTNWSTVGVLAAGYGVSSMISGRCGVDTLDKANEYDNLTEGSVAIMITVIIDLLLHQTRASDKAYEALTKSWDVMEASIKSLFDPTLETVTFRSGEMQELINQAAAMGHEADLEPRYWRVPWRADLFKEAIRYSRSLNTSLTSLEDAMSKESSDSPKAEFVRDLLQRSPAFRDRPAVILSKIAAVKKLLGIFHHETSARFSVVSDADVLHEHRYEEQLAEAALIAEVGELEMKEKSKESFAGDEGASLCLVLGSMHSIQLSLRGLEHKVLQQV